MHQLVGGIELGGSKVICAVGTSPTDIRSSCRIPTGSPNETLRKAVAFFREHSKTETLNAIGIASFGPIDLNSQSPRFGHMLLSAQRGWGGTPIVDVFQSALSVPVAVDTDVNAAAAGEHKWGAAMGLDTFLYITVGTGIGGGGVVNGRLLRGMTHPEMGHIRVPHDYGVDPFAGDCPCHGDCLEGLASGSAIRSRWGKAAESLPPDHPAWALESHYLALGIHNFICTISPERLVLGGGVMEQSHLYPRIRHGVQELMNGYLPDTAVDKNIDEYIVPPQLGSRAGVLGAIALALRLLESH